MRVVEAFVAVSALNFWRDRTLYGARCSVIESDAMKRTLLGVGIAVLLSLMLVPHGGTSGNHRAPFWESSGYPVLVTELIVQTIFFAVAAAIITNIPWTKRFLL